MNWKSSFVGAMLLAPTVVLASTWDIEPSHSAAHFKVKHLMVTDVRGEFSGLAGTLELDDKDVTKSTVSATVNTSTVSTREPKRDEHLRSPEFFDSAKFPTMAFKSKKVVSKGKGKLEVVGDLTIRDVTQEVKLAVELAQGEQKDPWGNVRRGATATTTIDRNAFGLKWNKALETGGVLVGNDVKIELDLSLVKKTPAKS